MASPVALLLLGVFSASVVVAQVNGKQSGPDPVEWTETDKGIPVDPMRTSYFVGRNSYVAAVHPVLPRWQEKLFLVLARFAVSAADFFGLPANRTVELGSRIEV